MFAHCSYHRQHINKAFSAIRYAFVCRSTISLSLSRSLRLHYCVDGVAIAVVCTEREHLPRLHFRLGVYLRNRAHNGKRVNKAKAKQSSAKKKYLMSMSNKFHREHIFKSNGIRWSEKEKSDRRKGGKKRKTSAAKREMSKYAESATSHRTSIHLKSRLSSLRKMGTCCNGSMMSTCVRTCECVSATEKGHWDRRRVEWHGVEDDTDSLSHRNKWEYHEHPH